MCVHSAPTVRLRHCRSEETLVLVLVLSLLCVMLCSWGKVHFPSSSSQQSTDQNLEVSSRSLLQSGWSTGVKRDHFSIQAVLLSVNGSGSEQNLMRLQVFIPLESLNLPSSPHNTRLTSFAFIERPQAAKIAYCRYGTVPSSWWSSALQLLTLMRVTIWIVQSNITFSWWSCDLKNSVYWLLSSQNLPLHPHLSAELKPNHDTSNSWGKKDKFTRLHSSVGISSNVYTILQKRNNSSWASLILLSHVREQNVMLKHYLLTLTHLLVRKSVFYTLGILSMSFMRLSPEMVFQQSWRSWDAEHLSALLPSLCSPSQPKPSGLGLGQVTGGQVIWRSTPSLSFLVK